MKRLPKLLDFDLSDSSLLTGISLRLIVKYLLFIEHLGFSRCYNIELPSYIILANCKNLRSLELFSMLKEATVVALGSALRGIEINRYAFSSTGRPTIGIRRASIWKQKLGS